MAAHGQEQHHITPLKTFLKVYASLIALTILTVFTATKVHLGALNTPLAMIIATVKVLIVMLWFMHLKYDTKLNKVTIFSAFFFLMVFFGLTAVDIFTRTHLDDISIQNLKEKAAVSGTATTPEEKTETPAH